MLIEITDSLSINPDAVETIERKGRVSCLIVMMSGEKHTAEFPYEVMIKRVNDKSDSISKVIRNIDNNTQSVRS